MPSGDQKYQSRENRTQVQQILMREWDPIGIAGEAGAEHEYDGYADRAYVMLMDGQSPEAIAAFLLDAAADHMGLGRNERIAKRSHDVAKRLIDLRQVFQARLMNPP